MFETLPFSAYGDLVGKKWVRRGRGPDQYDCYGLVLEIYNRIGFPVNDLPYSEDLEENADLMLNKINSQWIKTDCIPRSVIVFAYNTIPSHMGVMIDNDRFVHASGNYGTTLISKLSDRMMPWKKAIYGYYVRKELLDLCPN